jgi:hypothetical protein
MLSRYSFIILIILINLPGFGRMIWTLESFILTPILAALPLGFQELFLQVLR